MLWRDKFANGDAPSTSEASYISFETCLKKALRINIDIGKVVVTFIRIKPIKELVRPKSLKM